MYKVLGLLLTWPALQAVPSIPRDLQYFWFLNDLHYDPTYASTRASCSEAVTEAELGRYGHYECDAPWLLLQSSVQAMARLGPKPKFVIYAGDSPLHPKNYTATMTEELVLDIISNVTTLINDTFPDTPVYPVIGNHDYFPSTQLPPHANRIYRDISNMWQPWLGDEAMETFRLGGYYSRLMPEVGSRVRAVVLNTNLYLTYNQQTEGLQDPAGQLAWLHSQLSQARANSEKVHLMTHVPIGVFEGTSHYMAMQSEQNSQLSDIIRLYGDVLIGVYGVHNHFDTYRMLYKDGAAQAVMFIVPSVTPWKSPFPHSLSRNPAVRQFWYDPDSKALQDYSQYYLDLTKGDQAQWDLLYTFKQVYGAQSLTSSQLHLVTQRFQEGGSEKFERYYVYNAVNIEVEPCNCVCKQGHLCAITNVDQADFDDCNIKTKQVMCASVCLSPPSLISIIILYKILHVSVGETFWASLL